MISNDKSNDFIVDKNSMLNTTKLEIKAQPAMTEPQPFERILGDHTASIPGGKAEKEEDVNKSISALDELVHILSSIDSETAAFGFAPGFVTKELLYEEWVIENDGLFNDQYENLSKSGMNKLVVPLPSCENALSYFKAIRECWNERKKWAAAKKNEQLVTSFCSCISAWDHDNSRNPTMMQLMNQVLEQLMTTEASESCNRTITPASWADMYRPEKCPNSSENEMYLPSTSIRLLDGREAYIPAYINAALATRDSIDICLCYVFQSDPVQRYILLDLLPFMARTHNVTVRILVDLMTIESAMIKSAVNAEDDGSDPVRTAIAVEALKFLQLLPPGSPKFSELSQKTPKSSLSFLNDLFEIISSVPDERIQLRWWCARDKKEKFRIKSHIKCHIFDGKYKGTVITGGSNMSPMVNVTDSDMMLSGEISQKYTSMFNDLWTASTRDRSPGLLYSSESSQSFVDESEASVRATTSAMTTEIGLFHQSTTVEEEEWTDESCSVAFLNSVPSSAGEDCILRRVLGAIGSAEESITMCMGHSNMPMPMAQALAAAAARGVHVRLLFNSLYTCDLRGGQRDLFLSLRDLLRISPLVKIYVTALPSHRTKNNLSPIISGSVEDMAPPFLHSKYVVVDHYWSAAGSWNLWTRAVFYEMEAEVFVYSRAFAKALEDKFERECSESAMQVNSESEVAYFCPKGCNLCKQFGPFYE